MELSWNEDDTKATLTVTPHELFIMRKALRKFAKLATHQSFADTANKLAEGMEHD